MASLPTPVPPSGALSVVVTARGEDSFEVTFEGPLRLGWIARLVGALSRRHISIVRVVAERSTLGQWRAQLELRGQAGTPDVRTLDWEALCDEVPSSPNDASAPRLSTFRLERGEGDRLELVVTAPDEVGFLSSLFSRLGFLGLFAERISAFTRHGRIDDAFVLCGIGGEAPSIATEQALRTVLARLCVQSGNPKAPASSPGQKTPSGAPPGSKSPSSAPPGSKS